MKIVWTKQKQMSAPATVTAAVPKALVLCEGDFSPEDRKVSRLLEFFGIPSEIVTVSQFGGARVPYEEVGTAGFCVLISATLAQNWLLSEQCPDGLENFMAAAKSVFVHGFQDTDSCQKLLKFMTGDRNATVRRIDSKPAVLHVTDDFPELCGPMLGLRVSIMPTETDHVFHFLAEDSTIRRIISTNEADVFIRVNYRGVPVFLSASRTTIDMDSPSRESFDVKEFFCSSVPITMYLKWAFAEVCWNSVETNACLIVDDPLLWPQYGFFNFARTLELMNEHKFTTSLAFIPWNWKRTRAEVVSLFQRRPDRFSLSIHGCDHTSREFATRSPAELNGRIKIARKRMTGLEHRTCLKHHRIMIFPQGEFSAEAGRILKLNGFVAAVNTEVAPTVESPNATTLADVWNVAITKYGTFPIFTRRYWTHGIENCAFDALLGKPCLIVAHHQEFKSDGKDLMDFIDKVNSLSCKISWRSLGDTVCRSYRIRSQPDGTDILQIYASHLTIQNPSSKTRVIEFIKEERDPDCLRAVTINGQTVHWSFDSRYVRFSKPIPPGGSADVQIIYADNLGEAAYPNDVRYRCKAALRRYLSEFRDCYVARSAFLTGCMSRLRKLLR